MRERERESKVKIFLDLEIDLEGNLLDSNKNICNNYSFFLTVGSI